MEPEAKFAPTVKDILPKVEMDAKTQNMITSAASEKTILSKYGYSDNHVENVIATYMTGNAITNGSMYPLDSKYISDISLSNIITSKF